MKNSLNTLCGLCFMVFGGMLLASEPPKEAGFAVLTSEKLSAQVTMQVQDAGTNLPPLNKMHNLLITLAPTNEKVPSLSEPELEFDARMPAHRHGMVVKPKISKVDAQTFKVEGVKLHMPGAWELVLELTVGGEKDTLRWPFRLQR